MVGTGDWARERLAPALQACGRVRLDACVSPDVAQVQRFAADFNIPRTYPDLASALAGEPGAGLLVVSTADSHHVEALHLACDHGVPVYCEKPLANSATDAAEVAARGAREGLVATVGFSFRYSSAVQRLRADLAAGVLGDPWLVELWEQNPQFHPVVGRPLTWKADPAHAAGSAVFEYGAHVVDLATWLLGEVTTVSSQFATVVPGARLDDLAHLQLRFAFRGRGRAHDQLIWAAASPASRSGCAARPVAVRSSSGPSPGSRRATPGATPVARWWRR